MNKIKIIQLEGIDGSFKETNSKLIESYLKEKGYNIKRISFPNYNSDSSIFAKNYLNGKYNIDDQYIISTFFIYDMYNFFNNLINSNEYENLDIIICDRYIGSTLVYQSTNEQYIDDKFKFIIKIEQLCKKLNLKEADISIYLKLSTDLAIKSINLRGSKKDIIENDKKYLEEININGNIIANFKSWNIVNCENNGIIRSREEIFNDIKQILNDKLYIK